MESITPTEHNGLSIVLSNPSRFDLENKELLSGSVGSYVRYKCLGDRVWTKTFIGECLTDNLSLPSTTKVVILCGHRAIKKYCPELLNRRGVGLHSLRGAPTYKDGIFYVPTYTPQDTFDSENYELSKNPLLNGQVDFMYHDDTVDIDDDEVNDIESNKATKDLTVTRRRSWRYWLSQDIDKALSLLTRETGLQAMPDASVAPPMSEALDFLAGDGPLYLDIETDITYNLTCIGLGDAKNTIVIPLISYDYSICYDLLEIGQFFQALQEAFTRREVVIHNAMFDLVVLSLKYSIQPPAKVYDTMLAQHRISPETEKSLGHCVSLYTEWPYHKDEGVFMPHNHEQLQSLLEYNAKDIITMRVIHQKQLEIASTDKGLMASINEANAAVTPYIYISLRGIAVDAAKMLEVVVENEALMVQYQRLIDILVGPNVKLLPNSSQSCAHYFHDLLGYKVVARTDTGAPQLNEKALYQIALRHPDNIIIPLIIAYRGAQKENAINTIALWITQKQNADLKLHTIPEVNASQLLFIAMMERSATKNQYMAGPSLLPDIPVSSKMESLSLREYHSSEKGMTGIDPLQLRITTEYNLAGAKTLRKASRKLLRIYGTNLQNPAKGVLKYYRADKGYKLGQADQAGAEALIVAYLCKPGRFRDLFLNGVKPHVDVAMALFKEKWITAIPEAKDYFGLPPGELVKQAKWKDLDKLIKSSDEEYATGKMVCHAANFGMGANTFIKNVLKQTSGKTIINATNGAIFLGTYYYLYPEIQAWHLEIEAELKESKCLRNLFGYPRFFWGYLDEVNLREGYAQKPQSTVGCITTQAAIKFHNYVVEHDLDWHLLNDKHDSLLFQAPAQEIVEATRICRDFMAVDLVGRDGVKFKMRVECAIGDNWGKFDKDYNTGGMQEIKL